MRVQPIKKKSSLKISFVLTGFVALVWFLARVIPKPARAMYPCQRAAFPFASGFVIWIISSMATLGLVKKGHGFFRNKSLTKGIMFSTAGVIILIISKAIYLPVYSDAGNADNIFIPTDAPNTPMGTARGINPGRVAWVHDPDATSWDGSSKYWWSEKNIDQAVVDTMTKKSIQWLTGIKNPEVAWDTIFKHFNINQGRGNIGYQPGEKIAIKVNMNSCSNPDAPNNYSKTSPQVVLSYIKHLIDIVEVAEENITIYDMSRRIARELFNTIDMNYPGIQFMDDKGMIAHHNWHKYEVDHATRVEWSQNLTIEQEGGNNTYLPKRITEATYIINIANLKGHNLAGVTMCAKNHLGSFYAYSEKFDYYGPKAAGVHPYIAAHDLGTCGGNGTWDICGQPMNTYSALVDLMGHKDLGGKTLLFILDALYCSVNQGGILPNKWSMQPFNKDWTSSIFVSQDGVAIESVGLDFLRSEPTQNEVYGSVDNYLHEASLANSAPSGTVYDPEGDGTPLSSLGVHEHWNNASDKKYSRNLKTGNGIELINSAPEYQGSTQGIGENNYFVKIAPNPFHHELKITRPDQTPCFLKIYSLSGQLVFQTTLVDNTNIRLSSIQNGIYILQLTDFSNKILFRKKIIKE
ncbi:MAG: DUF362 domain-containing protein [bacterium]